MTKTMTRNQHLAVAIFLFIFGIMLNYTYRSYIYEHGINDLHLADTIGSWVAIPAWVNFFLWQRSQKYAKYSLLKWCIIAVVIGYVWEMMGLFGIHGVFDWYDIIAYTLSGILTYLIMTPVVANAE